MTSSVVAGGPEGSAGLAAIRIQQRVWRLEARDGGGTMEKARAIKLRLARGRGEEGQALVEYALILALVTIVAIGALEIMGQNIVSFLQFIADTMDSVAGSGG
jgi:Flp pilus assembly pilin Flp